MFRFTVVLLFLIADSTFAWTHEELSVFDLVEEVNKNFYELFEVSPVCFVACNYLSIIIVK